ncbi:hypothetical protein IGI04_014353 [Brassica rapa subsp. trilocularis]|uniref:Ysc84 actin-binding domain-containing protein n=1 Tax=Brassica rapa subsp. trilocularis TaxID=1813537 RepID=A0ABQ7MPF0_BRACM|nr:hypothetical protein IGI04_014353 [Brassica rapa subsp. trilocularis]
MAESKPKQPWMVNLSTFVAVCGSLAFGSCPGYSSPAQAAIRNDLFLTIAEAMRVSSAFCVVGSSGSGSRKTGNGLWNGSILLCVEPIEAGAKAYIFAGGATAEHLAADIGDLVLINCLLKLDEGNRPLEVAALRENKKIVETPPIDNKEENSIKSKSLEAVIKKDLPEDIARSLSPSFAPEILVCSVDAAWNSSSKRCGARFGFGFGYRVKVSSLTRNNEVFVQGAMEHHVLEVRAGLHHGARRHGLRNPKFFP